MFAKSGIILLYDQDGNQVHRRIYGRKTHSTRVIFTKEDIIQKWIDTYGSDRMKIMQIGIRPHVSAVELKYHTKHLPSRLAMPSGLKYEHHAGLFHRPQNKGNI